jgi:hypothetical protein
MAICFGEPVPHAHFLKATVLYCADIDVLSSIEVLKLMSGHQLKLMSGHHLTISLMLKKGKTGVFIKQIIKPTGPQPSSCFCPIGLQFLQVDLLPSWYQSLWLVAESMLII